MKTLSPARGRERRRPPANGSAKRTPCGIRRALLSGGGWRARWPARRRCSCRGPARPSPPATAAWPAQGQHNSGTVTTQYSPSKVLVPRPSSSSITTTTTSDRRVGLYRAQSAEYSRSTDAPVRNACTCGVWSHCHCLSDVTLIIIIIIMVRSCITFPCRAT
eukprot:1195093-Prorocentrum_minimum.AAC.1